MHNYPVLYSYRRCPYAIRARMAIGASGLQVEQREIVFWDKPVEMLQASPKGTVPVLILPNGQVLDESRDIIDWALSENDPLNWRLEAACQAQGIALMDECDFEFKTHLDHYKYADRFPDQPPEVYRQQGEVFLQKLEDRLLKSHSSINMLALNGAATSAVDIAIFPFIRQFAAVDKNWFAQAGYPLTKQWLNQHLNADYFMMTMKNRPVWQAEQHPLRVIEPELKTRDMFLDKALKPY